MKRIANTGSMIIAALLLASCTNAVTYHHSERFSLATVEAKTTDPLQPLQGTVGIKVRTILVTPGKEGGITRLPTTLGEAASVISDFNLDRTPDGLLTTTKITSAFITGQAAVEAPKSSSAAISGVDYDAMGDSSVMRFELLNLVFDNLDRVASAAGADPKAVEIVSDLQKLAVSMKELTLNIDQRKYYRLAGGILTDNTVAVGKFKETIVDAFDYESLLRSQIAQITAADDQSGTVQFGGAVISKVKLAELRLRKFEIEAERRRFFELIGSSSLIHSAVNYVVANNI